MGHRPLIGNTYLKVRCGKNRSERAWYVRVMVPKEIRHVFRKKAIEESLHTTDLLKARRERNLKVVDIFDRFARARLGRMTSGDIALEAENYWRAKFQELQKRPGDLLQVAIQQSEEHETLGAELAVNHLHESIVDGFWLPDVEKQAKKIASSYDTILDAEQHRELCLALTYAEIDIMDRLVITHRGGIPPAKPILNAKAFDPLSGEPLQPTRHLPQKGVAVRVRQAAKEYIESSQTEHSLGWTEQTRRQTKVTLRFFADFTKDAPLDAVSRQDVAAFLEALSKLDPKYGKSKPRKNAEGEHDFDAALKRYPAKPGKGLSIKTRKRHCGGIAGLFEWAKEVGHIAGENPAKGHRFSKRKESSVSTREREHFTIQELRSLLEGTLYDNSYAERVQPNEHSAKTALCWLIPIALFTGMRLDEICGLRIEDIREEASIEFFNVTSYEGHRLKTPASERKVPVCSSSKQMGLLRA